MARPSLSPEGAELLPTLFARATAVVENLHETCVKGQRAGLSARDISRVAHQALALNAELDALLQAIDAVVRQSE